MQYGLPVLDDSNAAIGEKGGHLHLLFASADERWRTARPARVLPPADCAKVNVDKWLFGIGYGHDLVGRSTCVDSLELITHAPNSVTLFYGEWND